MNLKNNEPVNLLMNTRVFTCCALAFPEHIVAELTEKDIKVLAVQIQPGALALTAGRRNLL